MYKLNILALSFLVSGCGAAPRKAPAEEIVTEKVVETVATKAGSNLVELDNESQLQALIDSSDLVLVDFFATWCGPCKTFGPILHQVAPEFPHVTFVKVDTDRFNALSAKHGVKGLPTVKIYKNGKLIKEMVGLSKDNRSAAALKKFLKELGA